MKLSRSVELDHFAGDVDLQSNYSSIGFNIFMIARFTLVVCAVLTVPCSIIFLSAIGPPHLKKHGVPINMISAYMAVPAFIYAVSSPFIHLMTKRMSKRGVILIGCLIHSAGVSCIGTFTFWGLENNAWLTLTGFGIMGFACGMIMIPGMTEMLESL